MQHATPADGGAWVLVAVGAAILIAGVFLLRSYALLWRRGIEVRATILKTFSPWLADVQFEDRDGKLHLVEQCLPPRYGRFVQGQTRAVTYPPGKPDKWEWKDRRYHRFMSFFSLYIVAMGLGLIAMGLHLIFDWPHFDGVTRHRPGWSEPLPAPAELPMPH